VKLKISVYLAIQLFCLTVWSSDAIANSSQNKPPVAATRLEPEIELPFHLVAGYLIQIEGQIGTQNHLKFVLDTGASMSVVDSTIADKLRLRRQSTQSFNFDRNFAWEQATFPDVQFGTARASNIAMLVGRLAEYSEFARGVDAIIGTDLLRLVNFSVDLDARKITFRSSGSITSARSRDPLSNCLFLEMGVQGHMIRLLVDSGFPGILLFEERLTTSVSNLEIPDQPVGVILGERLRAKRTTLRNVLIGSTRRDVTVLLAKAPAADVLPGIVGVIGISALNAHRVNFNFNKNTISWE
jgi:predicted aspartyl protease